MPRTPRPELGVDGGSKTRFAYTVHMQAPRRPLFVFAPTVLALAYACAVFAADATGSASQQHPAYAGNAQCAECHADAWQAWLGSHHDLAMQKANGQNVLGDFDDAETTHYGVTTTFSYRDGRFYVLTDGPDGKLQEYEVTHTFGIQPLQQYLVRFPKGHYQALPLAWDTRPAAAGGQRWFHIYAGRHIAHTDELHWTKRSQNWNFMCAECHSTNLQRNYDLATDSYATTWSEIDVGCEACHGPGSRHIAWAAQDPPSGDASKGLTTTLHHPGRRWVKAPNARVATLEHAGADGHQLDVCATCHSRRRVIGEHDPGQGPLLDTHVPALVSEPLYQSDGQIEDEVYVYGSFVQSKMYRAGVICSDCHEPHSLALRAEDNGLCTRCHSQSVYDTSSHHHHPRDSTGSACVSCHMPSRLYMVVDARRDHSIRIPRPDLSVRLGVSNACNQCHAEQSTRWAAEALQGWYEPSPGTHYGETLYAGRNTEPGADRALARLAMDPEQAAIVRASALRLLAGYPSETTLGAAIQGLVDPEPLVRLGALDTLEILPPPHRYRFAAPLLADPVRAIRIRAARLLGGVPLAQIPESQRTVLSAAQQEYVAAELINAERPETHVNLGTFWGERGDFADATAAFETAMRLDPEYVPALVNYADIQRAQAKDEESAKTLREAVSIAPEDAAVHHALGLALIRLKDYSEASEHLEAAARLAPEDARYLYVFAIALHSSGQSERALLVLEEGVRTHPNDRAILQALASIHAERAEYDAAIPYAENLVLLDPRDNRAKQLLAELRRLKQQ
jgi:predicted CXXCH cytochrome family protein